MKKLAQLSILIASSIFLLACNNQNVETENATNQETKTVDVFAQASSDMLMHPEYAKSVARMAYIWGYPMVNMVNRRAAIGSAPEPGRMGDVIPVSPTGQIAMLYDYIKPDQSFIACPNQDVVYGLGFFALDKQPVVLQVPEIGDRFWVYAIYDARTDQVGHLGKPYGTKSGFYLLVGPNWAGEKPKGITEIIKSPTELANIIPRLFMDDTAEDRKAIQPIVNQVMIYPLTEFTGKMQTKDWTTLPAFPVPDNGGGETKWVVPEKYFDQLPTILSTVAPLPGEEALYDQFRALLEVANSNPDIKKLITETVVELDKNMIHDFLKWKYNGRPAGNGWNRSVNNAEWGLDYFNRTGTARSNMFENRPSETQYFYTDNTSDGQKLIGSTNYIVTFKAGELPPVNGFWSMTMYNEHHLFHPNELNRYSLGTKNKSLKYGEDGSLTLYLGNANPGTDKEANWIPAPKGEFSVYIRSYWGKKGITEGTWIPPEVEKLK